MGVKNTVSMQTLADELAISKVTVSKALNGKDGVSEELKKKIFETAEKYGYVLRDYGKRRTRKIAIVMSKRFNTGDDGKFYMGMYDSIISEFGKHSCSSVMLTPDRNTLAADLKMLSAPGAFDGLILLGILESDVERRLDSVDLPKVYVDVYDVTHVSDSVVTENIYSTYELTDVLIRKGHREIGFVGTVGMGSTTSITDRYLGYLRRLLEQGITPRKEWIIPDRDEEGKAIRLEVPEKLPTAFVCNCDETAFRFVKELRVKGLQVPDDISIVGFDDSVYARLSDPPLTTVAVDVDQLGRTAVKKMLKYMEHPEKKGGEVIRIPGKIVYRNSVREIGWKSF